MTAQKPNLMRNLRHPPWHALISACALFVLSHPAQANPNQAAVMLKTIEAYHQNAPPNHKVLHVVYFVPAGVAPQANYESRISAILLEIHQFIRDGMEENGFGEQTMPLVIENDRIRLHVVTGKSPAKAYDYGSGDKVRTEAQHALKGTVDFDEEFVLILSGMCRKKEKDSYFFYAPYYGASNSNHQKGLCYAADCELMDLDLIGESDRIMTYEEHSGTFTKSVSAFISSYVGGIAHELGHGLSLPHNGQTKLQKKGQGTALMGSGNHTFLRERWSDRKGSFLTFSSAMRLASHPLFTGSSKGRNAKPNCAVDTLRFSGQGQEIQITGTVKADVETYGVIAYADPDAGRSDYDALSWGAPVVNGTFSIKIKEHVPGKTKLRLTFCHVNGDTTDVRIGHYDVDADGADIASLNDGWLVSQAEKAFMEDKPSEATALTMAARSEVQSDVAKRKLNHLLSLTQDPEILDLSTVTTPTVSLSDVAWSSAQTAWGQPCRNHYYFSSAEQYSLFLELDGTFHEKGLYAHAKSNYAFDLNKRWTTFHCVAGLQKGVPQKGSAIFIIKGDGKELFHSDLLTGTKTATVEIDVGQVDRLELITESGKQGNAYCWSVWGSPLLHR